MFDHNQSSQIWDFRAMSLKTWTWVPVLGNLAEINTKTGFFMQAFGSKQDFLEEHMNVIFSF